MWWLWCTPRESWDRHNRGPSWRHLPSSSCRRRCTQRDRQRRLGRSQSHRAHIQRIRYNHLKKLRKHKTNYKTKFSKMFPIFFLFSRNFPKAFQTFFSKSFPKTFSRIFTYASRVSSIALTISNYGNSCFLQYIAITRSL